MSGKVITGVSPAHLITTGIGKGISCEPSFTTRIAQP